MKVTINGILNTAIGMKNQKNIQEESLKNEGKKIKSDSVQLKRKLASRLGIIQNELKDLQYSLTKNQIIKEGINQLIEDFINDENKTDSILNQVKFKKSAILVDFLGGNINYENIMSGNDRIGKLIERDIASLKGLQVEIENIAASTITDSDIEKRISDVELSLSKIDYSAVSNISELTPDMVIELIR